MDIGLISEYLETLQGRDKMLRTLSYVAKLATLGASSKEMEIKLKTFGTQMSGCRIVLGLLDDIPVLNNAISNGWFEKEPDRWLRWIELLQTAVNIVFLPIEHISWAGNHKIVKINTAAWDNATIWFWIVSLHLSLLKSMRKLKQFKDYKERLIDIDYHTGLALKTVSNQRWDEILNCTCLVLDISYAVSYLPPGVLWGSRLKIWQVGALGTLSSVIGLYQALKSRAQQKKYS